MFNFKKILCPIDFSEASYKGLERAVEIAAAGNSQLYVIHVAPALRRHHGDSLAIIAEDEPTRRAAIVGLLCEVISIRVPKNIRCCPVLDYGEAATEILRTAVEENADLIILATHGDGGWRSDKLGAVTGAVLRGAPCPVLVIVDPSREGTETAATDQLQSFYQHRVEEQKFHTTV